jgi:hypothetical protein
MKPRMSYRNGVWHCRVGHAVGIGSTMRRAWDDMWFWHDVLMRRR